MHRSIIICILILVFHNIVFADELLQNCRSFLLPSTAHLALLVIDLRTGREVALAGTAQKERLHPASLVKLFITSVALEYAVKFGNSNSSTALFTDGTIQEDTLSGSLYLQGKGNALLTEKHLCKTALTLTKQGIRKATGDIIVDDSFFDPKGMERTSTGPGHAAPEALGVDLHTVVLTVSPMKPGQQPSVQVEPLNGKVRVAIAARTTGSGTSTIRIIQLDDTSYRINGNISAEGPPVKQRFALKEPATYAAGVFRKALQEAGIEVMGEIRKGKVPAGAIKLAEIEGPPLDKLLQDMNLNSLNVVADNLLLSLGAERFRPPGTREKGLRAVNEFLESLDLPKGEAVIADGSGLNANNRVTVSFMARYLAAVTKKPWFETFYHSRP